MAAAAAGARAAVTPSDSSLWRWATNGVGQRVQTGNATAVNLRGEHLFLLVVYRLVYPKAEADEVIAFIAQHSRFPRLYSRSDISIAEKAVGLTRKRGSTTADSRRVRCCVAISSGCRPTRSASWERRGSA